MPPHQCRTSVCRERPQYCHTYTEQMSDIRQSPYVSPAVVAILFPDISHLPLPAGLVSALDWCRLWLSTDHSGEHHSSLPSLPSPGGHSAGLLRDWSTEPLGAAWEEIVSTPAPVTVLLPSLSRLAGRPSLVRPAQIGPCLGQAPDTPHHHQHRQ